MLVATPSGPDARARRRRASIDRRRRSSASASPASPCSSRPSSTSCRRSWHGASSTCSAATAARSICGSRPAPVEQPRREMTRALARGHRRRRLLAARAGARQRDRDRRHGRGRCPRRSRRSRASASGSRAPDFWSSTSPDRLHAGWLAERGGSHVARLLAPLARDAALVTRARRSSADACHGSAPCAAIASRRWASANSASPATSPISTAPMGWTADAIVTAAKAVLSEGRT